MNQETAASYGIDYHRGLENCLGNQEFYKKMLTMFLADTCFSRAEKAYAEKDKPTLFNSLHELKGVSGNLALTRLYTAVVPTVEKLRGKAPDDADIGFSAVRTAYEQTCDGIRQMLSEC